MNVKTKRVLPETWARLRQWGRLPGAQLFGKCAAAFGGAMLLSAIPLGERPLALGAYLVLALDFFPYSLFAGLGAIAGSALFWPWAMALEPVAVTVLCFAAAGLFHDAGLAESDLFASILALCLCAAVGFVFLLDRGFDPAQLAWFAAKLALAFVSPVLCRGAVRRRESAALWLAGLSLFVGAACLYRPWSCYLAMSLGYAVAVTTGRGDILPTLLCGLGIDLTAALPCAMSAPLCAGALLCRMLARRRPVERSLVFAVVGVAWQLLCGVLSLPLMAACVCGSFLGLVLPTPSLPKKQTLAASPAAEAGALRQLAQVFSGLHRTLSGPAPTHYRSEIAEVYDATAAKVCHLCVHCQLCWELNARQTYDDLCAAALPALERGSAVREDFPPDFVAGCCHMEGFLTAMNQELDRSRSQRQLRSRLSESRRILASQYLFLSRLFTRLADPDKPTVQPCAAFTPEFAVCGARRPGERVSGDRGASFHDRWNHFYVLLCDGMGSGEEAARQSGEAVRTLAGLLEAGVAPDSALELLNGFYILQADSRFSTVDLLQIDLVSGTALLYKWGAAPSYLKTGDAVQTLGTVVPPPGVDGGGRPAQQKLSLGGGQTLIMVTDGAFGDRTRQRAAQFQGEGAKALANYLIAGLQGQNEDDLTAAVVRLLPKAG